MIFVALLLKNEQVLISSFISSVSANASAFGVGYFANKAGVIMSPQYRDWETES